MSRSSTVRVPAGIITPGAQRCFLHVGGGIEMIDLDTGDVLDRADCDAEPLDAADNHVIAARPPASFDAGRVAELVFDGASIEVRSEHPLLDPDDLAESVPYFERVEVRTELSDEVASIVADVHNRYTGGAPPGDDLLDRSRFVHRTVVRLDLTTGDVLDRTGERLEQAGDGTITVPDHARSPSQEQTRSRGAGRAVDHDDDHDDDHGDDHDDMASALPPGATPVAELDRRIVYETTEFDPEQAVERHYLHVADVDAPDGGWRRQIAEVRQAAPPPPPP